MWRLDELLTVKQVAELLKVNTDFVYMLRDAGTLPFCKLGHYKCRRSAVEEFMRNADGMDYSYPYEPQLMKLKGARA